MTAAVIVLFGGVAALYLSWRRLLAYLHEFQKVSYRPLPFLRWLTYRSLLDLAVWLAVVCRIVAGTGSAPGSTPGPATGFGVEVSVTEQAVGLGISVTSPPSVREIVAAVIFVVGAIVLARMQADPRQSETVPLDYRGRARRLQRTAMTIVFLWFAIGQVPMMILLQSSILEPYLFLALAFAMLPLLLLFAHVLLGPYERGLQQTLEIQARARRKG